MGMTLQQLNIHTTNADWEVEFMDRTKEPRHSKKPLFKILAIQNFGMYYKPNDVYFISEETEESSQISKLNQLFPVGASKMNYG